MSPEAIARPTAARGPMAWAGQLLLYGLFALGIGVFSQWPPYRPLAEGQALIKVSFVRVGKPVGDCRQRSAEELARLPPTMRAPEVCPRERSPVTVELDIDGRRALTRSAAPAGLSRDGASALYERLVVPAGERRIAVRLSDDQRPGAPVHRREATLRLAPGQVLVIDFDPSLGGITLQ
ncbi:MAG: hypothetical protein ACKVQR_07110 [Aquabacterium sp.]